LRNNDQLEDNGFKELVKIGAVADFHQEPLDFTKEIRYFVDDMNNRFFPNFVVVLGDLVGGKAYGRGLRKIASEFAKCYAPCYYVIGNHDLETTTRPEFKKRVGIDYDWTSITVDFLHVIFLDSSWGPRGPSGGPTGHIPQEELEWLKEDLSKISSHQPIVVFSHFPIRVGESRIDNEDTLMNIFKDYNLIATFSGHCHPGAYQKGSSDGIHHFILHRMGHWVPGNINGSYAKITISPNLIKIKGECLQMSTEVPVLCPEKRKPVLGPDRHYFTQNDKLSIVQSLK